MTSALYRIGRTCARHPFRTFGVWLLVAVVVFSASSSLGGEMSNEFSVPGVESQTAFDRLEERFPSQTGATGQLVFHADDGTLADPEPAAAIAATSARMAAAADVARVATPQLSPDRRTGFVDITYDVQDLTRAHYDEAEAAAGLTRDADLQTELSSAIAYAGEAEPVGQEKIGILAAVVVLLVAFGSVIAMGIPIGTALFGIAIGLSGVTILAGFVDTPEIAPMLAGMIGLGVGIDYALFIVTRHRSNLADGMEPVEAAGRANATAGAAVLFAGATVVIAILGLHVAGIPAITTLGWSAALVVAVSVLAALTLLPAFLGWAGRSIDRLRLPHRKEREDHHNTASGRWAGHVGRHPWRYAAISLVVLAALAGPATSMRIGMGDDGTAAPATTQRRAHDLLSDGFGPGFNGPLQVVVDTPTDEARAALPVLEGALAATPGIAAVSSPVSNEAGDTAVIIATPTTSPGDEETSELVDRLRDDAIPAATAGTGATAWVGSSTALMNDLSERLMDRLPLFIGAVVLLSFLLLTVVFRSIVVPAKAALMNLLSIGAAYGVLVAVFQWGWGAGLIGLDETMAINPFVPLIMFAVLFGLSMDYEVFLLSRVREAFVRSGDGHESVVEGLGATARVITSAALIMISVFGAFIFGTDPVMKMFGLGLSVAVLIDATLVRMVLVPATMSLLGGANWWLPRWLDRILPHLDLERDADDVGPVPEEVVPLAA